jgi:hypothetical protein
MKKNSVLLICGFLFVFSLLFTACPTDAGDPADENGNENTDNNGNTGNNGNNDNDNNNDDNDDNNNDDDNNGNNDNTGGGGGTGGNINKGKNALKSENYPEAIANFEAAYKSTPDNAEALVYSTIGKLASIAWSKQAGDFFKDHLGLKSYPNTLDALIHPKGWFEEYPHKDNPSDSSLQPPLNVPGWVTGKDVYTDSLVTGGGGSVASSATWPIILIANLIDRNTTGLNDALDDVIAAIFENPFYIEAETRTANLKGKDPVKLDAGIIDKFGLSEFYGTDDIYIGWAELELLLSALKLVKATLLYVDSYSWEYDIGFVRNLPWDESVLDEIDTIAANRNKVLPLRTGFMTARSDSGTYLTESRTAYAEALTSIIGVYDYYTGTGSKLPAGFKDELNKFKWGKDAAGKLKNAIRQRTTFHVNVKNDIPNGDTYDNTNSADTLFSINFDKFFTPGQLALDKLIETESSGTAKAPVFYSYTRNPDDTLGNLTKITNISQVTNPDNYDGIALKFKIEPIGEIIGNDFTRELLEGLGFIEFWGDDPVMGFPPRYAAIAWAAYHWNNDSKDLVEDLIDEIKNQ